MKVLFTCLTNTNAIYSMNLLKFELKRCYSFLNICGAGRMQEYTLLACAILQQVVQDCCKYVCMYMCANVCVVIFTTSRILTFKTMLLLVVLAC